MGKRSRWSPVAILEWAVVVALGKVFAWLPESAAYTLGESAGRLAFSLDRRHRTITVENLTRAFPGEYTPAEIERLARAVFANLGRTAVDVARSGHLLQVRNQDAFQVDGADRVVEAGRRGKGVLMLTAHFGPWELLPLVSLPPYWPGHVVARPLDNPRLDDLLTAMQMRGGCRVIRKRAAVQPILQALRRGESVGILIDQHTSEREGVVVPFFGRPASTAFAPALIAMRSGAAVLPAVIMRDGRGGYRVVLGEEVPVRRSGNLKADLAENTARFTAVIEAFIREHPEQWFWVHRRWKTQPPLDRRLERHSPSEQPQAAQVVTMTPPTSDRRKVARLPVPWQLRSPDLELRLLRLLDLSSTGARIEHTDPLGEGLACEVDLPPALGRGQLTSRVVWTKLHKRVHTFEGDTRVFYQSGLIFVGTTPEQRATLEDALQILQTKE